METKKNTQSKENVQAALASKWPKLTSPEIGQIVEDHDKLTGILKTRYSMSKDDAQKETLSFFKPYEKR